MNIEKIFIVNQQLSSHKNLHKMKSKVVKNAILNCECVVVKYIFKDYKDI